jgi:hypothetical protein
MASMKKGGKPPKIEPEPEVSGPGFTAERTSAEQVMSACANISGMMAQHPDLPYGAETALALITLGISMLHEMTPPEHKDLQKEMLETVTDALWNAAIEVGDRYDIPDLATFTMICVRFDQSLDNPEARERVLQTTDPWIIQKFGLEAIKASDYYEVNPKKVSRAKGRKGNLLNKPKPQPLKIVKPPVH